MSLYIVCLCLVFSVFFNNMSDNNNNSDVALIAGLIGDVSSFMRTQIVMTNLNADIFVCIINAMRADKTHHVPLFAIYRLTSVCKAWKSYALEAIRMINFRHEHIIYLSGKLYEKLLYLVGENRLKFDNPNRRPETFTLCEDDYLKVSTPSLVLDRNEDDYLFYENEEGAIIPFVEPEDDLEPEDYPPTPQLLKRACPFSRHCYRDTDFVDVNDDQDSPIHFQCFFERLLRDQEERGVSIITDWKDLDSDDEDAGASGNEGWRTDDDEVKHDLESIKARDMTKCYWRALVPITKFARFGSWVFWGIKEDLSNSNITKVPCMVEPIHIVDWMENEWEASQREMPQILKELKIELETPKIGAKIKTIEFVKQRPFFQLFDLRSQNLGASNN